MNLRERQRERERERERGGGGKTAHQHLDHTQTLLKRAGDIHILRHGSICSIPVHVPVFLSIFVHTINKFP